MANATDDARRRAELIGERIRSHRGERTQSEVAAAMGESQATISRWELGGVELSFEQARRVEIALDIPLGTLGREAGFVSLNEQFVAPESLIRFTIYDSFDEAESDLRNAAELDLGVVVANRWRTVSDGTTSMEWTLYLLSDAPERDELP